jgi:preprotein translocase subunit SecF
MFKIEPGRDIDFMKWRRVAFTASGLAVLASVFVLLVRPGPRWSTDFKGGTEVQVAFTQPVTPAQVRDTVHKIGFEDPEVVQVQDDKNPFHYLVRVKEVSTLTEEQKAGIAAALCVEPGEGEPPLDEARCPPELRTQELKLSLGGDKVAVRYSKDPCGPARGPLKCPARDDIAKQLTGKVPGVSLRAGENNPVVQNPRDFRVEFHLESKGDAIMNGLRTALGPETVPEQPLRVEWIGPKAGKLLRDAAIKSIVLAVVLIMVYIAFRFDIRFAPGGIVALVHDVVIALGATVVLDREFTLSTVAAALTILGFSINDTVVLYDRIRENLGKYRNMSFPALINRSTTEMLGRTIKTSTTVIISVTPFLFWGTGVIKDFAFTMLVGLVVGVYSSVYIAAPFTEWVDRRFFGATVRKKRRITRKKKPGDAAPDSATPAASAR